MDNINGNINNEYGDLENEQPVKDSRAAAPQMPQNSNPVRAAQPPKSENPQRVNAQQGPTVPPQYAGPQQQYQAGYYSQIPQQQPVPPQNNGQNFVPPQYRQQPYQQPHQPYGGYQQVTPDYYRMTYGVEKPPKEKMSGGLKAFLIIALSLLGACLIGFISYVAINADNSNGFSKNFDSSFDFTMPSEYGSFTVPTEPELNNNEFPQSDAKDKTNPSYKGISLQSKPKNTSDSKYNASYSFNKLQDSVVGVICYADEDIENAEYASQGSGIVVTSDGYIVTNSHVINNSRTDYIIKVVTSDKKEYSAGVVGYDSRTDLAVLKIEAKGLSAATFGDSKEIQVTEDVVAIGNPRGIDFQNSVTKGIVSALNREASSTNNSKFIQIDAPINPGNSGGPLCNMYGQVIGINTSKIVINEYEGMGFAIPSATVKSVVDDIIKYNHVTNRVKLGIVGKAVYLQEGKIQGIEIAEISKNGPMDGSGAEVGDVITEIDGEEISTFTEVYNILENHKAGDKVRVKLYRVSDNKTYDVTVSLQADE